MFMDDAHHFLPGLLRCKGKGVARSVLSCISFFFLQAPGQASARVTRLSQEVPSPAPPSIQDGSPEPPEVIRPPALLFPVVLGAMTSRL